MATPGSRPDIQARTYDELFQFGGKLKAVRREHQRILPFFAKARTVLDVGCGRGVFMEMLRDAGITPVGVDLSPDSVRLCQELGFDRVYHEDALGFLKRHEAAFDGVVCSHIIEHMPYEDAIELVRSAYAALMPGGRMAIVTPNARDLRIIGEIFWLDPTHVRPYPLPLLDAMLRSAGFHIVHKAQPLGQPNKRGLAHWPFQVLLLGSFFGHPTSIIIGEK
jgi:2-polyprenyl-3-methyl-5-hydroxy-6-metoxy-1,4-benzoquinol methylase